MSLLRITSAAALCALFLALALRQHSFVDANAVNVLFWDQWDLYNPFFKGGGIWDIFSFQHGPHRQGISFLITRVLAELSGWNVRWDAFAISFCMMGGAVLGLRLATRCGMKFGIGLAAVPLFFLNLRQYEGFVGASNLSHGAMPMFLFMLYCLTWFWENHAWRLVVLSLLSFILTFTGFGIFVAVLTPILLGIELLHAVRSKQNDRARWVIAALVASALSWFLFSRGYRFDPAVDGFRFPYEKPIEYLYFMGLMFTNFFGIPGHGTLTISIGVFITLSLAVICGGHGWQILRAGIDGRRVSVVLFGLSAFALLYTMNTAVGRVFLGFEDAPAASRYVPLMVPAGLALLLQIGQIKNRKLNFGLGLFLALCTASGTVMLHENDQKFVTWFRDGRQVWKETYLRTHNQAEADRAANFKVFPVPVDARMTYLEKHKLNLFIPEKP